MLSHIPKDPWAHSPQAPGGASSSLEPVCDEDNHIFWEGWSHSELEDFGIH